MFDPTRDARILVTRHTNFHGTFLKSGTCTPYALPDHAPGVCGGYFYRPVSCNNILQITTNWYSQKNYTIGCDPIPVYDGRGTARAAPSLRVRYTHLALRFQTLKAAGVGVSFQNGGLFQTALDPLAVLPLHSNEVFSCQHGEVK